jgi:hypothetical protein
MRVIRDGCKQLILVKVGMGRYKVGGIVRVMVEIIIMDGMATLVAMITEMTMWKYTVTGSFIRS